MSKLYLIYPIIIIRQKGYSFFFFLHQPDVSAHISERNLNLFSLCIMCIASHIHLPKVFSSTTTEMSGKSVVYTFAALLAIICHIYPAMLIYNAFIINLSCISSPTIPTLLLNCTAFYKNSTSILIFVLDFVNLSTMRS